MTFTPEKLTGLLARNAPIGMALTQVAVAETDVSGPRPQTASDLGSGP